MVVVVVVVVAVAALLVAVVVCWGGWVWIFAIFVDVLNCVGYLEGVRGW